MSRRGLALFIAMCVIWGIPYLLIKVTLRGLGPVDLVFVRFLLGALLLVPIALTRVQVRPILRRWGWIVAYTIIEMGIPWVLLSDAELRISSSLSGLLVSTVPLIGVVIGVATRSGERHGWRRILGLCIGLVGVGVLVGFNVSSSTFGAIGEVIIVAICYATGPYIINRKLSDLPALGVIAGSLLLAAVAYAPAALVQLPHAWPSGEVIAAALALGVVCTAIAFLVFFALIAEVGPVRATVITYVNPAVAVTLGVLLLHEPLTGGIAVGFALILAGSVLAARAAPQPSESADLTRIRPRRSRRLWERRPPRHGRS
ncbi:MAG TPA: DMT family transporter [Candidatus Saccharimonadales bacterium]|nr:DMT family transporter [Candidatus Saccharimonadales bacterium]